ncbi:MAG: DUF5317 family protein, partial [Acidimicrobiales bacterium]
MRLSLLAVLAGAALAIALGGRPRYLPSRRLRLASLPFLAVVLYWVPQLVGAFRTAGVALVLCSYAALLAFAVANLRLVGMAVVLAGLGCNATVILANQGMPVDAAAVVASGLARPDDISTLDLGSARKWREPTDDLSVLGDIIPVPALSEVVSFGDLILAFGLADVAFRLLGPARSRGEKQHQEDRAHRGRSGSRER